MKGFSLAHYLPFDGSGPQHLEPMFSWRGIRKQENEEGKYSSKVGRGNEGDRQQRYRVEQQRCDKFIAEHPSSPAVLLKWSPAVTWILLILKWSVSEVVERGKGNNAREGKSEKFVDSSSCFRRHLYFFFSFESVQSAEGLMPPKIKIKLLQQIF